MAVRSASAEIEEATAGALTALPPSWAVVRDPVWPGDQFPDVDHIVVGPPGIFVIDSRSRSGQDLPALLRATAEAAVSVSGLATSVRFDYVHGVICVAERGVAIRWVDGVLICSTADLIAELTSYVEVIPGGVGRVVAAHIEKRLKEEAPRARTRPKAGKAPKPTGPAKPRRRRTPVTAAVAAMLAGLAIILAVSPSVLSSVPDQIAELVDNVTNDSDNPFDGKTPKPPVVKKKKEKPARSSTTPGRAESS